MSNNFKRTGGRYCSKAGHDSNDGLSPDSPKRTPTTVNGQVLVVGAGQYSSWSVGVFGSTTGIVGDGRVIFTGSLSINLNNNYFQDLYFNALTLFTTGDGLTGTLFSSGCFINTLSGVVGRQNRNYTFSDFVVKNANNLTYSSTLGTTTVQGWIVLQGTFTIQSVGNITIQNSYFGTDFTLVCTANPTTFRNNCFRGIIRIGGVDYELKKDRAGNAVDPNPSLPDVATASGWSSVYTNGNFNEAPKFNDEAADDFTLQSDSPLIRAAFNGFDNIGGSFAVTGLTTVNTDDGNADGTRVIASATIDTSIPNAYKLIAGQTEGYVDYVRYVGGFVINSIKPLDSFQFDTDAAGGSVANNNVIDAQPLTADYARVTTTNANTGSTSTIQVPTSAGVVASNSVRVAGQERTITGIVSSGGNDTITLNAPLTAAVASGTVVTFGTAAQLAALLPNRLTVLVRTRSTASSPSYPFVDSEWDNELSAAYGVSGQFFQQEIDTKPGLIISGSNVYGKGDSAAPTGITPQDLAPQWIHIRIYKRNNYSSNGL